MVPAGKPVDAVLENITPLLSPGDIVVDAGNSYFEDTNRRIADLAAKNLHFMGMGVSGGEKGARVPALCRVEIWSFPSSSANAGSYFCKS
jgi:6-phosphogluconate dehydrogenase